MFSKQRGIDRLAYLGLMLSLSAYFVIIFHILDALKTNPGVVLTGLLEPHTLKVADLLAFLSFNAVGWLWGGLFLVPRLANIGISRWWAIPAVLPVIGWPLHLMGLLAPPGCTDSRKVPRGSRSQSSRSSPEPCAGHDKSVPRNTLHVLKWTAIGTVVIAAFVYSVAYLTFYFGSMYYYGPEDLGAGNIAVPTERTRTWSDRSDYIDGAFEELADRDGGLEINISRLVLGRDIDGVNRAIQSREVGNHVGSGGNWDFRMCVLTLLLYSFGDKPDLLYPETVDHIVNVLMTEKGGEPLIWTPKMFGLPLPDTENHILQTESSRYLTNQWIARHGNPDPEYDNVRNGLEDWLLEYLKGIETGGLFEYNSIPYAAYSIRPLLNLASFAAEPVAAAARRILDRMNWEYALGSLQLRQYPPFCRQASKAQSTNLDYNHEFAIMKGWISLDPNVDVEGPPSTPIHLFWTGLTDYRLPDTVADWLLAKPVDYFVRIGHGRRASPEIYSGGPGYVISSGGVAIDLLRETVARPTVLLLEDAVMTLDGLLHLAGPGDDYRGWNNTGVYKRFAVAAGPVRVPSGWEPAAVAGEWSVYERSGQRIGVYSSDSLGIFCLLPEGQAESLARALKESNPDTEQLRTRFRQPGGGVIEYDVNAPKDQWAIRSVDGAPVDRDHQSWPLMQGEGFPESLIGFAKSGAGVPPAY